MPLLRGDKGKIKPIRGVTVFELLSQREMNKASLLSSASSGHTRPGLHRGQHSKETEGRKWKGGEDERSWILQQCLSEQSFVFDHAGSRTSST